MVTLCQKLMLSTGMSLIILNFPPPELNPNKRLHWARKSKFSKRYRDACRIKTLSGLSVTERVEFKKHKGKFAFTVTFHKPDNRARDDDNIFASFKAGRDGIADALGVDDNRFIAQYKIGENVKGGMVSVEIEVIE